MADTEDIITTPVPSKKQIVNDVATIDGTPRVLDALREELSKKVRRQDVYLEVPERPSMAIRFSPNVSQHQVRAWRRNSGEDTKAGLDSVKFACYVLGNTCTGINGELVTSDTGTPLGFGDEAIIDMLGVDSVADCIKAIFVVEPHIEAAALAVMEAAGYSDSVEQVDPTKKP
jgi:hypothetical protein